LASGATDTRKEQIYEAASTLFSQRGYHSTSVRDIARELDLQGGSLYAHIASKEDVLWEIVNRAAASFQTTVAPLVELDLPAAERLRLMIHAHVGVVVGQLNHAAVFFQDWQHLSEPRRGEVRALRDNYEVHFRRVLADGIADGAFAQRDPKLASIFMLTALNALPSWFRPAGARTADDVAEEFAKLAINGLRATR
jgi:TetR/AcrR family transcriptional regulator, cholesterol catabolism regulator